MSEKIDYSKYECPYSHLEKKCGHELHSPEGYQDIYSVWCQCGFRAPVFYLDPVVLGLKLKGKNDDRKWVCQKCGNEENFQFNYDYSKKELPIIDVLCNECGEFFELENSK